MPCVQDLEVQLAARERQIDALRLALAEAQQGQQRAAADARAAAVQLEDAEQRFRDLEALMTRIASRNQ
jgi:hypothetical protein